MFCTRCGAKIDTRSIVCAFCGARVTTVHHNPDNNFVPPPHDFGNQPPPPPPNYYNNTPHNNGWGNPHMPPPPPMQKTGNGFGIASMILGIIAVVIACCLVAMDAGGLYGIGFLGLFLSVPAIIFSIIQLITKRDGTAIAGLILGIVATCLSGGGSIYFFII